MNDYNYLRKLRKVSIMKIYFYHGKISNCFDYRTDRKRSFNLLRPDNSTEKIKPFRREEDIHSDLITYLVRFIF